VHTVDVVLVCLVVVVVLLMIAILARQRQMLRSDGTVPIAVQRGHRWLYGVGRYSGSELRLYRAIGVGTRPTRVLRQGRVELLDRRGPTPSEAGSLPPTAVIVQCRSEGELFALAIGESAFTGFVSWLESSAPI
jgi:uncharacterized protein DUF2550